MLDLRSREASAGLSAAPTGHFLIDRERNETRSVAKR